MSLYNFEGAPTRPVLRYHGGKWRLGMWITGYFPVHDRYVEPFGGAASVLLRKSRVPTEVWNDLDDEVCHLFSVLRNEKLATVLIRQCALTPFARKEYESSFEFTEEPVERARRFIVRSFFAHSSKAAISGQKTGFRSQRGKSASPARDWATYPEALQKICARLRGVVFEHAPAIDVIHRYDRAGTLFYCDPPYLLSTRNPDRRWRYAHEMSEEDHRELAECLRGIHGMAVVSGYSSILYDELYEGWTQVKRMSHADGCAPREECLWLSPGLGAAA